jgi:hypothetical protein
MGDWQKSSPIRRSGLATSGSLSKDLTRKSPPPLRRQRREHEDAAH